MLVSYLAQTTHQTNLVCSLVCSQVFWPPLFHFIADFLSLSLSSPLHSSALPPSLPPSHPPHTLRRRWKWRRGVLAANRFISLMAAALLFPEHFAQCCANMFPTRFPVTGAAMKPLPLQRGASWQTRVLFECCFGRFGTAALSSLPVALPEMDRGVPNSVFEAWSPPNSYSPQATSRLSVKPNRWQFEAV